ncbi:hypothetical protein IOC62_08925 [Delftia sp. SD083]|nr:hypothetical protein [Delftia sp. SD083]
MSMVHEMRMMTGEIYSINWLHIQYFSGVFLQCYPGGVAAGQRLQPSGHNRLQGENHRHDE